MQNKSGSRLTANLAFLLASSILIACSGERSDQMHEAIPDRIESGWSRVGNPTAYDRQTIFDYINGAGEVYLAYGFQKVLVSTFTRESQPDITLELFDMGSAHDAYGVFSYSRDEESEGIGGGYQFLGSLLCFWQSRYFVCVQAAELTETTRPAILELARKVSGLLPSEGSQPELVQALPRDGQIAGSERYLHTHPSLNYHYYLAQDNILDLDSSTNCVLARYESGAHVLVVNYPKADAALKARQSFVENYAPEIGNGEAAVLESGKYVGVRLMTDHLVLVFDAESEAATEIRLDVASAQIRNLRP